MSATALHAFPIQSIITSRIGMLFWTCHNSWWCGVRLCEMALEESVAHFMAAVLTFTRAITEEGVQSLQADRDQLVAFFSQHCKPDRAVKLAAPLQDLKDVAAADSVDAFVLTYTTLLQVRYIGLQC